VRTAQATTNIANVLALPQQLTVNLSESDDNSKDVAMVAYLLARKELGDFGRMHCQWVFVALYTGGADSPNVGQLGRIVSHDHHRRPWPNSSKILPKSDFIKKKMEVT
jgi:hypothetical protein